MSYNPPHAVDHPGSGCDAAAGDPRVDPRARADGRRDRIGLRGDAPRDLAAPGRTEGGRSRERAARGNEALLPRPAGGPEGAQGVPRGLLDVQPGAAEARRGSRGKEEAWKQE